MGSGGESWPSVERVILCLKDEVVKTSWGTHLDTWGYLQSENDRTDLVTRFEALSRSSFVNL